MIDSLDNSLHEQETHVTDQVTSVKIRITWSSFISNVTHYVCVRAGGRLACNDRNQEDAMQNALQRECNTSLNKTLQEFAS